MSATIIPSSLLRAALAADGLASGAMGLLLTAASGVLSPLLGLPQPLLLAAGLICIAWGAFVGWLGRRGAPVRGIVWAVIALNAVWVVESILAIVGGFLAPTTLGATFVIAQALLVAVLAEAQFIGLRRSNPSAPAVV